jgi:hypothetical protein
MTSKRKEADEIHHELGGDDEEPEVVGGRSHEEARVVAGFEDIVKFVDEHGRAPAHGVDNDIFERLYAVRLDRLLKLERFHALLAPMDKHALLVGVSAASGFAEQEQAPFESSDDLAARLGIDDEPAEAGLTRLKHVRSHAEVQAAEEIATRTPCADFETFEPLFDDVHRELKTGARQSRVIRKDAGFLKADIKIGDFFILGGQTLLVAAVGEAIKAPNGETDARLRVIYSNGTESNLLLRSLQRALYKDETSRRVTDPEIGGLFGNTLDEGDIESGTIYVLRTLTELPQIAPHREFIHKIGVTGGDVKARIADAKDQPTYLFADVEVVATYKLAGIKRSKFEALLHRFLAGARLDVEIPDRFGQKVQPREWFFVPLPVIAEVIERIGDGSITRYEYDRATARLKLTSPP